MPVGPIILCAEKAMKSTPSVADVDRHVRDELRAVGDHQRAGGVRHLGDVAHRVDRAEHVGHGRDADELDAVDEAVEVVEHEATVPVDRDVAEVEPPSSSERIIQGTMLAWCSISVSSTASPARRLARPRRGPPGSATRSCSW